MATQHQFITSVSQTGNERSWSNTSNAYNDSETFMHVALTERRHRPNGLRLSWGSFVLPDNADVRGIEVEVVRQQTQDHDILDNGVRFLRGGVAMGQDKSSPERWTSDMKAVNYGGEGDMWGLEVEDFFTPAGELQPNLQLEYKTSVPDEKADPTDLRIRYVKLIVHYAIDGIYAKQDTELTLATPHVYRNGEWVMVPETYIYRNGRWVLINKP